MVVKQSARPALIIEDEMIVAWAIKDILEGEGFDPVMVVTTDSAAVLAAEGSELSLVVCDLDLGNFSKNGLDTLDRIDPDTRTATVIYSGIEKGLVAETILARRPNAAMLNKPASVEEIREAIKQALSQIPAVQDANAENRVPFVEEQP